MKRTKFVDLLIFLVKKSVWRLLAINFRINSGYGERHSWIVEGIPDTGVRHVSTNGVRIFALK